MQTAHPSLPFLARTKFPAVMIIIFVHVRLLNDGNDGWSPLGPGPNCRLTISYHAPLPCSSGMRLPTTPNMARRPWNTSELRMRANVAQAGQRFGGTLGDAYLIWCLFLCSLGRFLQRLSPHLVEISADLGNCPRRAVDGPHGFGSLISTGQHDLSRDYRTTFSCPCR